MTTYFIYSITNRANGFVYIGVTVDFEARINQHLWQLRSGRHQCKHLQSDFILYGESQFEFKQIKRNKYETFLEARQAETNEIVKQIKSYNSVIVKCDLLPVTQTATEPKLCTANPRDYYVWWRDITGKMVKRRCGINKIKDLSKRAEAGSMLREEFIKALNLDQRKIEFKVVVCG